MKNVKVYHLEFVRDIEYVVWEYSSLPEPDRTNLSSIKFEATFDFVDKQNNYNFLIITDSAQMNRYLKILQDNLILHFSTDISSNLLKDKVELSKMTSHCDSSTKVMLKKFETKLEKWMLSNQELDNVLDLINEKGVNNLRDIDRKFLENYGKDK